MALKHTFRDEKVVKTLDGQIVPNISSYLDDLPDKPIRSLALNKNKGFRGQSIGGEGFVLALEEARMLIDQRPKNREIIFPYLNGEALNNLTVESSPNQIINFGDMSKEEAESYPALLEIVRRKVKLSRNKASSKREREKWWQFARSGARLREATSGLGRALTRSRVCELHMLEFLTTQHVFGDALVVFAYDDFYHFALLQSYVHETWLRRQASSLRTDIRYTPTDCFQTFPFPQTAQPLAQRAAQDAGEHYYEHRRATMLARQLGLTKTYNLFHDPECKDEDIAEMRRLHTAMDEAILRCYGWEDIDLSYGFYPNDRGKIRYMPSRAAQRELFTRLIGLNQLIAAQEAAQGIAAEEVEDEECGDDESE